MDDIEARLRAAAFGTELAVPDAVLAAAATGRPLSRWLAAVVLGARGHYARAAAMLEPLLGCRDRVVASLAASTLASHRRQLGGHASARVLDAAALRAISSVKPEGDGRARDPDSDADPGGAERGGADPGWPDPDGADVAGAVADALLGLAADALALGRQREARTLLARVATGAGIPGHGVTGAKASEGGATGAETPGHGATGAQIPGDATTGAPDLAASPETTTGTPPSWRTRVRHAWVSAEVELAAGDADAAYPHAERAAALARAHGGSRHVLKSDLVLAAALSAAAHADPQLAERAGALAGRVFDEARKLGLYPLAWPAALVLSSDESVEGIGGTRRRQQAEAIVHAVLLRTDPLGRELAAASPWVPGVG